MSEEKALLPHEYYEVAFKRTIAIAEAWLKVFPKPEYILDCVYTFDFDKTATYKYVGLTINEQDLFYRDSDRKGLILTKYSHIILK